MTSTRAGTVNGAAFSQEAFDDGVGADGDEGVKRAILETKDRAIFLVLSVVLTLGIG